MNEQWNHALDQVEDEFLMEAARYHRKRRWPGMVAAAAVLMLAVGWWALKPRTPQEPTWNGSTGGSVSIPDSLNHGPSNILPGEFSDNSTDSYDKGNIPSDPPDTDRGEHIYGSPSEGIDQTPPVIETLDFSDYENLQTACLNRDRWYLHRDVMVPYSEGQPLVIQDITAFEKEMYNQPWVWYFLSHVPHVTIRIPTSPALTANLEPDTSGAEALRLIWPDAPNLHNRDMHKDAYSQIREVTITTSEGEKKALLRQEADRDQAYLTFLQSGTLVTVAGPANELQGAWLETFALIPISDL